MMGSARAMLLSLLRDRVALAMDFALPPLVFVVFAAIFASATGAELRVHVGLVDLVHSPLTQRLAKALAAEPGVRLKTLRNGTLADLRDLVRSGGVDVGVALRFDLSAPSGEGPSPILLVEDSARGLAADIALGQIQKTVNERMPDVALARILRDVERAGGVTEEERIFLDEAFRTRAKEQEVQAFSFATLFQRESATGIGITGGPIAYYAGAVAVVFLLFSAMHGSVSMFDERQSGIFDRLLASPTRLAMVIFGKFLFLVAKGVLQAALIFAAAWLLYSVEISGGWLAWVLTCVLVSAMAAGLSLGLCSICATRQQIQLVSTFGVLLFSAIGGSMVPRFLMPDWLKNIGWLTPNTWAIEAFQEALGPSLSEKRLLVCWAVLLATALAGLAAASVSVARTRRH
jgi:ABC-2 type transport system permease protein